MANERRKPDALRVGLSTLLPFVVGLLATRVTIVLSDWNRVPAILVGWCAVQGISALWLNRVAFRNSQIFAFFLAATASILLIWWWQREAFNRFIPKSGLAWGYFLNPAAHKARFWMLTCPFAVGLTCLSVCFIAALVSAWRAGYRGLLMCMIPWWLITFLIFTLPSLYLDAQGNATIFI